MRSSAVGSRSLTAKRVTVIMLLAMTALAPGMARAQGSPNARALLNNLFTTTPTPAEINSGLSGTVVDNLQRFPEEIHKLVGLGIYTLPIGSSSAGFTYALNPTTGEPTLKSDSFGPVFAERPLTSGKGVFNLSFNLQHSSFDTLNGTPVSDQGENSRSEGLFVSDNGGIWVDGYTQFITDRSYLEASATSYLFNMSYGLAERLDVGLTVPLMQVDVTGRRQQFFDVTRSFQNDPNTRADFPNGPVGVKDLIPLTTASATGLGDLMVRAKYNFLQSGSQGLAATVDVRLPTGSEEDLLGLGKASTRAMLVGALSLGSRASVYGNGGYTFGGLSDEVHYVGGMDLVVGSSRKLTISGSFIGQTLRDGFGIDTLRTLNTVSPSGIRTTFDRPLLTDESLNILNAAIGAKFNIGGQWLLSGAVLFPVNDAGFRGGPTPIIGIDRTWTRGQQ